MRHYMQRSFKLLNNLGSFHTIHVRHVDVHDNQVIQGHALGLIQEHALFDFLERSLATHSDVALEAEELLQHQRYYLNVEGAVVYHENLGGSLSVISGRLKGLVCVGGVGLGVGGLRDARDEGLGGGLSVFFFHAGRDGVFLVTQVDHRHAGG